jgi:hypothetical protein
MLPRPRDTGSLLQSHQLGHRGDTKLLHHPTTVDLHCLLPCTQLSGNLLVQQARNDELQYFELARRQQTKKTPSPILLSAIMSLLGRSNQCVLDALKQLVSAKRLPKKIDRARFYCLRAHRYVAMAGNKYLPFRTDASSSITKTKLFGGIILKLLSLPE